MYRLRTILLMAFAAACLTFAASAHGQCTRLLLPIFERYGEPHHCARSTVCHSDNSPIELFRIPESADRDCERHPQQCRMWSFAEAFKISAYLLPYRSRTVSYTFAAPHCRGTTRSPKNPATQPGMPGRH
jgi:hypothetical protein